MAEAMAVGDLGDLGEVPFELSADGLWFFDGDRWQPIEALPRPEPPRVEVAAAVAADPEPAAASVAVLEAPAAPEAQAVLEAPAAPEDLPSEKPPAVGRARPKGRKSLRRRPRPQPAAPPELEPVPAPEAERPVEVPPAFLVLEPETTVDAEQGPAAAAASWGEVDGSPAETEPLEAEPEPPAWLVVLPEAPPRERPPSVAPRLVVVESPGEDSERLDFVAILARAAAAGPRPHVAPARPRRFKPWRVSLAVAIAASIALGGLAAASRAAPQLFPDSAVDGTGLGAARLLDAGSRGLAGSSSYRLVAVSPSLREEVGFDGEATSIHQVTPSGEVDVVASGGQRFLRAGGTFFSDRNPVLALHAAGSWIQVPEGESLGSLDLSLSPARLAACLFRRHGPVTWLTPPRIGGSIELQVAGSTPMRVFLDTGSAPSLTRLEIAGSSPCLGGPGEVPSVPGQDEVVLIQRSAGAPRIQVPAGAVDLSAPPWCGMIIGSRLAEPARRYLQATFDATSRLPHDSGGPEHLMTAEISAQEQLRSALEELPGAGLANRDARREAFLLGQVDGVLAAALAAGSADGYAVRLAELRSLRIQLAAADLHLRADLGLPAARNACWAGLP